MYHHTPYSIHHTTNNIHRTIPIPILKIVLIIQVVDLLAPYAKGGKIGLFGGAGVGKTVVIMVSHFTYIIHHTYYIIHYATNSTHHTS